MLQPIRSDGPSNSCAQVVKLLAVGNIPQLRTRRLKSSNPSNELRPPSSNGQATRKVSKQCWEAPPVLLFLLKRVERGEVLDVGCDYGDYGGWM